MTALTLTCMEVESGVGWYVLVTPSGLVEFEAEMPEEARGHA